MEEEGLEVKVFCLVVEGVFSCCEDAVACNCLLNVGSEIASSNNASRALFRSCMREGFEEA